MLAGSYRDIADYVKLNYTGKVFFRGDMSFRGFQYYMEKNGFVCVNENNFNELPGNFMVSSVFSIRIHDKKIIMPELGKGKIKEKYVFTKNPFRTMNPWVNAGFHLNMYGLLPYSFSNDSLEKFTIYKIK